MTTEPQSAKPVPEWKLKLRRTGRWSTLAAFVVGVLLGVAQYGTHAAALGYGVGVGLMLALAVMIVFGIVILIRGLAEPPPGRPGS